MSRQYLNASKVVDSVIIEKKSFKSVCANMKIGKVEYALAAETLKSKHILDKVFEKCNVSATSLDVRYGLLLVMAFELLLGKKKIDSGGVVKRKLKEIEPNLKTQLNEILKNDEANNSNGDKAVDFNLTNIRKYVRVNETKITREEALKLIQTIFNPNAFFDDHIATLVCLPSSNNNGLGQHELVKTGTLIIQDKASCFPSEILGNCWFSQAQKLVQLRNNCNVTTSTTTHTVKKGNNINIFKRNQRHQLIVSKVNNSVDDMSIHNNYYMHPGDILDSCSAPGNKTSHLANFVYNYLLLLSSSSHSSTSNHGSKSNATSSANLNNLSTDLESIKLLSPSYLLSKCGDIPKIFAFEKNQKRYELLLDRMKQAGVDDIVHTQNTDFLKVDPFDTLYENVKYGLLDPSCSGSGLVNSIDRIVESSQQKQQQQDHQHTKVRLSKLKEFQISIILHAMKFPRIEYIVYSTCSIHSEENEEVVAEVLKQINIADSFKNVNGDSCINENKQNKSTSSNNRNMDNSFTKNCHNNDNIMSKNNNRKESSQLQNLSEGNTYHKWELIAPTQFLSNEWTRHGFVCEGLTDEQQKTLIRCSPTEDLTSGFFVALFHKIPCVNDSSAVTVAATVVSTMDEIISENEDENKYSINDNTNNNSNNYRENTKVSSYMDLHSQPQQHKRRLLLTKSTHKRRRFSASSPTHGWKSWCQLY